MPRKSHRVKLTPNEKKIVKRLFAKKWRDQDIQYLVNIGRDDTINSSRIAEVKRNKRQVAASEAECEKYIEDQHSYNSITGLKKYTHERLVRAREAMILAVQVFNNPAVNFRSHTFSVLAHIAWTYAMHHYYDKRGVKIIYENNGQTLALSTLLKRSDSPLNKSVKANLNAIIKIHNRVEHHLLQTGEGEFDMFFQACALNFDKFIRENFTEKASLSNELGFAIQLATANTHHLSETHSKDLPPQIASLSSELNTRNAYAQSQDYKFQVIYTLTAPPKGAANIKFIAGDDNEGNAAEAVLKEATSDDNYPYDPTNVVKLVKKQSGINFTMFSHTKAWKRHKVRPPSNARKPEKTAKKYCTYNKITKSYSYNDAWVERLIDELRNRR